jgi:hypothetical protein
MSTALKSFKTCVIIVAKTCGQGWQPSNTLWRSDYSRGYIFSGCDICIAEVIQCAGRKKIKDTDEMVQSGLTVVPEFQVGIASIVATLAIAAIIMTAKRMSFLQMRKMY